ncbi:ribokinase [Amycolatopsis arida]|uniref:Ribokinase n=1 Tax=Amycolatopsis arida TaxID=587909 RepID=A0A1I5TPS8_9PSEU|nr:ribokinase [Amycolatopsis arida]TDX96016.1 ribokinase [Amycolatopsis arida]SFP85059.1 ribokinase [Amycolatopsis arida]
MTAEVLVVGSANADLVVAADRRPGGGETVLGGDTRVLPGGKGANTAVAAARLGADVALVGAVGDDPHGRLLLDSLRSAGVRTELVRTVDRPTGAAYITVTPDGENSILVSPGANAALRPADIDPAGAKVVAVSMEVPLPTVEHAVTAAAAAGARVVLNLSPVTELAVTTLTTPTTLAGVDLLLVNEHEAALLLGAEDPANIDPAGLLDRGPRSAVVTLGARGALLVTEDGPLEVPAPRVEAVDTTGAGDAFAGALATALATALDTGTEQDHVVELRRAIEWAARVAALSVTRSGAQPSYPTADEVARWSPPDTGAMV